LDAPCFEGVEILLHQFRACPFPTAKVESDLDVFPDLEGINGTYPILGKLKADILRKEGVIDVFNNE
jgi:hypothetical protein